MNQYLSVKREYPDAILLFRLGDFYEMFYDDAKTASEILGIALTSRDRSKKNPVPLCGVPFHSVEPYISKLLGSGNKVAVCEQVGDPKQNKGTRREKGCKGSHAGEPSLDSENLESKNNNFLVVRLLKQKSGYADFSFCDISTGEFQDIFFRLHSKNLLSELAHVGPKRNSHPGFKTCRSSLA